MTVQRKFEFGFGIGSDKEYFDILRIVHDIAPDILPFYLLSTDALVGKDGKIKKHVSELPFVEALKKRMFQDSAGFSVLEGTRFAMSMLPETVADLHSNFPGSICIAPDAPMYEFSNQEPVFWMNKERLKMFYAAYRKKPGRLVYETIHGNFEDEDNNITLAYREKWLQKMKKIFGAPEGYAMRFPETKYGLLTQAFFSLHPWSHGIRNCHLLVGGGIHTFPLLIYIADRCYDLLTADATSFTIQAAKNLTAKMIGDNGIPRTLEMSRGFKEKYRISKYKNCNCKICLYFEAEIMKGMATMEDLVEANFDGRNVEYQSVLRQWIVAHNIYIVESYLDSLREKVKDHYSYKEHFRSLGYEELVDALDFVDKLVDELGPEEFPNGLKLLKDSARSKTKLSISA